MGRMIAVCALLSILSCCLSVHAQMIWGQCRADMQPDFADCECATKSSDVVGSTDVLLQCIDAGYTDARIITKIPFQGLVGDLTNVTMTGNNFEELPVNLFGDCSNKGGQTMGHSYLGLDYLDLSNNNIHVIHGKTFHCIQNLRYLLLNDNNLDDPDNSPRMFSDLEGLAVLHLRNAFNFDRTGEPDDFVVSLATIFEESDLRYLKELNLASNYISRVSDHLFDKLERLEVLDLSNNYLIDPVISPKCKSPGDCPIKELYLNSNSMTRLSKEFMDRMEELNNLEKLDLSDNPYWCDCSFKASYEWMKKEEGILVNPVRITCNGPPKVAGKSVLSLEAAELEQCVTQGGRSAGRIVLTIFLVGALCVLLGVMVWKRNTIKEKTKAQLNFYFPRLYRGSSGGYDSVAKPSEAV